MVGRETFNGLLESRIGEGLHVCVGLDTDIQRLPESFKDTKTPELRVLAYNEAIIDATADLVAAYKPNIAFYEALGAPGIEVLARTVSHIARHAPDVPVILDAKRADIDSTNAGYVTAVFDELGAHAVTVHPYLGHVAMRPFLKRADKGIFVLARTSNRGAGELQDLMVDGVPLYRHLARLVATDWNGAGNCGLVVGATYPDELALIRTDVPPTMPLLIPGVGAQGGDLESVVRIHADAGSDSYVVNASRSVIFAGGDDDFAAAARTEVARLNSVIAETAR